MNGRFLLREMRTLSHKMFVILGSIALGVAAITSVHALADSIRESIRMESQPMIAGDLVARSMHPFPESWLKWNQSKQEHLDFQTTQTHEMMTMASNANQNSTLVELKAVSQGYPLYGKLEIEPTQPLFDLLDETSVLVQDSLLQKLEIQIGDVLFINGVSFVIVGKIVAEPDRMNVGLTSGPRVLMSVEGLQKSNLEQFGSRITRRIQYKTDSNSVSLLQEKLQTFTEDYPFIRVQGGNIGQPSAQRGIANTERFLSMVAMLAMLIGCIGVIQTVHTWLQSQKTTIATYRCLGWTQRELLLLYTTVVCSIVFLGAICGLLLSYFGLQGLYLVISPYLPIGVQPQISWMVALEGIAMGMGCSVVTIAYPLRNLLRISPLSALRSDVEPIPISLMENMFWFLISIILLSMISIWQARDILVGMLFVLVVVLMVAMLYGGALVTTRLLQYIPQHNWIIRHSFSSFRRPSLGLTSSMVALGLGVMVVVSISVLQYRLQNQFDAIDTTKAPTNFLMDIQQDQIEGVSSLMEQHNALHVQSAPVVMARLSKINDRALSEIIKDLDEAETWSYTREQRLTYGTKIDPSTFVEGMFPSREEANEICLEVRYAERWGVGVGDRITFDVLGIPLEFQVTALRRIQWETFEMNFLLVAEPDFLKAAPQFRLMSGQFLEQQEQGLQQKLSQKFPNVTVLSLREIVTKVSGLLENLSIAVQGMGVVSVLAGILILIGTLQTTAVQRQKQVQLLETLGATKQNIRHMFLIEFAILGVLAGSLGVAGAIVFTWVLQKYALRLEPQFDLFHIFIWFLVVVMITIVSGLLVQKNTTHSNSAKH